VIKRTNGNTVPAIVANTTMANSTIGPTVGLFAIPAIGKEFDLRIWGRLGFTILSKIVADIQTTANTAIGGTSTSTSDITGNTGSITLYVWNQDAKSILTLEKRLATKARIM
jgi:hypothetical protein